MSGAGKKIVDVAAKASKSIDWDGMAKLLASEEARREFVTLRRTFDEVNSTFKTKYSMVFLNENQGVITMKGKHPGQLKDKVASPGGTTIVGIHELEKSGFRGILMNVVVAAAKRSRELS